MTGSGLLCRRRGDWGAMWLYISTSCLQKDGEEQSGEERAAFRPSEMGQMTCDNSSFQYAFIHYLTPLVGVAFSFYFFDTFLHLLSHGHSVVFLFVDIKRPFAAALYIRLWQSAGAG
jgi:hypothetical protein